MALLSRPGSASLPGRFPGAALGLPCIAVAAAWQWAALGSLRWQAVGFFGLLIFGSAGIGTVLIDRVFPQLRKEESFPLTLLLGICALNLWLFIAAWALPFSLVADFWIALGACALFWLRRPPPVAAAPPGRRLAEWLAIAIALSAATGWSQDAISPFAFRDGIVALKSWSDSIFHAGFIRVFANAAGPDALQDPRLAGEPLPFLYNHAAYLLPALCSAMSGITGYLAFTSFMVPFGVFLSGLAAFCLMRPLFGQAPAAGSVALLLLPPDASFYGLQNKWLGYFWLQQIAPSGLYGVAVFALAWLLVVSGCRERRLLLVAAGFLIGLFGMFVKAHVFLINAPLLWMYPVFAYAGLRGAQRLRLGLLGAAALLACLAATRLFTSLPELRWADDPSSRWYLGFVLEAVGQSTWRAWLAAPLAGGAVPRTLAGLCLLLGATFGAGIVLYPALAFTLRHRWRELKAWFPPAFVALYALMALGLALEQRVIGTPEELLHRPFVWAYFVLAAWNGAALCSLLAGLLAGRPALKRVLILLLAPALALPFIFGRGVQRGPAWGVEFTNQAVPQALFSVAREIRGRSAPAELVQDSATDSGVLAALADRRPYVGGIFYHPSTVYAERSKEIAGVNALTSGQEALAFFSRKRIDWYLLRPEVPAPWREELEGYRVLGHQGYGVYRFGADAGRR